MNDQIKILKQWVAESRSTVFFGGAGVSTESGIPDFRSSGGLFTKKYRHPAEYMLSRSFFESDTAEFFEFYRNAMVRPDAKPNKAHTALASLEKLGRLKAVVTQNIDGLHTAAGSKAVYELHGSCLRNYCIRCKKKYGLETILADTGIPHCTCGGIIKPDVVLYDEQLDGEVFKKAEDAVSAAGLLIVGGTSLTVYPAAGLVSRLRGGRLVIINKSPTPYDSDADLIFTESIGDVLAAAAQLPVDL